MSLWFGLYYENDGHHNSVFNINITHNLNAIANKAGVYDCLWRPEEFNIRKASDIQEKVHSAIVELEENGDAYAYIELTPKNKWGTIDGFIKQLKLIYKACVEYPNAKLSAHR
jgi:hypothetical protein